MTEENDIFDFSELDVFDFDTDAFGMEEDHMLETRLIKPPLSKDKTAAWKNAVKTASKINIEPGMSYFGIIDGSFIFGDLIEALFTQKLIRAHRMDISTLSMSEDNVDSLATLIQKGYVKELNLIVSDYFYSHERNTIVKYIYQELDIDNRFQLAVAGTHTKIITARLTSGINLAIHGSANLRSSGNIEQIVVQDSAEICDFMEHINDTIIEKFKTINKSVRRNILWQTVVQRGSAKAAEAQNQEEAKSTTSQVFRSDVQHNSTKCP